MIADSEQHQEPRSLSVPDILAWVASFLFHPLLMPSLLLLAGSLAIDGFVYQSGEEWWKLMQFVFILTFAFPGLLIMTLRRFGLVKDLTLGHLEDRPLPMLLTSVIYAGGLYLMRGAFALNYDYMVILIGITLTIMLTGVISVFAKVSAHAIGTAGALAYMVLLGNKYHLLTIMPFVVVLVTIWGITVSARLQLGAHTPAQVWWGTAFGIATSTLIFLMLQ